MGEIRNQEGLIDPAWLIQARKNRKKFILRVVLVFAIFSVLAFWALPSLVSHTNDIVGKVGGKASKPLPGNVSLILGIAGWFKAFWVAVAIGCGAAILLALTGKIDGLIPTLNIVLLLVGAGVVAFAFYVFYLPSQVLLDRIR